MQDSLGLVADLHNEMGDAWERDFEGTSKQIKSLLDEAEEEASGIAELIDRSEPTKSTQASSLRT